MKITDIASRAGKTAVQAFFAVLIPETVAICANITAYDFSDWKTWALPIVAAALGAGISAGWNAVLNATKKEEK